MTFAVTAVAVLLAFNFHGVIADGGRELSRCTECEDAVIAITDYIAAHKNWRKIDYRIDKLSEQSDYWLYQVIYLPDARNPHRRPGGGESFWVYYNPTTRKIAKVISNQ